MQRELEKKKKEKEEEEYFESAYLSHNVKTQDAL